MTSSLAGGNNTRMCPWRWLWQMDLHQKSCSPEGIWDTTCGKHKHTAPFFKLKHVNYFQMMNKKACQWWTSFRQFTPSALVSLDESLVDWVVITVSFGQPHFQQTQDTFKTCVLCWYYRWAIMQRTNGQMCKHVHNNSMATHGKSVQERVLHQQDENEC